MPEKIHNKTRFKPMTSTIYSTGAVLYQLNYQVNHRSWPHCELVIYPDSADPKFELQKDVRT